MAKLSRNFRIFDQTLYSLKTAVKSVFPREQSFFYTRETKRCFAILMSKRREREKFVEMWLNVLEGLRRFTPGYRFFSTSASTSNWRRFDQLIYFRRYVYRGLHPNGSRDLCCGGGGKQTPTTTRSRRADAKPRDGPFAIKVFFFNVFDSWVHINSAWVCAIFIHFLVVVLWPNEIFAPPLTWKVSLRCAVIKYVFVLPH